MAKKNIGNIKCDVESCKYNDCEEGICELESIKVSCTCDNSSCKCTESTICDSFKCADKENKKK